MQTYPISNRKEFMAKLLKSDLFDTFEVKEVIIATSFTAEGEATAFAVSELLSKHYPQLKLTRIARGVPAGAEIEYTDVNTVAQAMLNRRVRESD